MLKKHYISRSWTPRRKLFSSSPAGSRCFLFCLKQPQLFEKQLSNTCCKILNINHVVMIWCMWVVFFWSFCRNNVDYPLNEWMNEWINQTIKQPSNQAIKQSSNQANQWTNESMSLRVSFLLAGCHGSWWCCQGYCAPRSNGRGAARELDRKTLVCFDSFNAEHLCFIGFFARFCLPLLGKNWSSCFNHRYFNLHFLFQSSWTPKDWAGQAIPWANAWLTGHNPMEGRFWLLCAT